MGHLKLALIESAIMRMTPCHLKINLPSTPIIDTIEARELRKKKEITTTQFS